MAGTPEKMLEHLLETQIGKVDDSNNFQKNLMSSEFCCMILVEVTNKCVPVVTGTCTQNHFWAIFWLPNTYVFCRFFPGRFCPHSCYIHAKQSPLPYADGTISFSLLQKTALQAIYKAVRNLQEACLFKNKKKTIPDRRKDACCNCNLLQPIKSVSESAVPFHFSLWARKVALTNKHLSRRRDQPTGAGLR